MTIMLLSLAGTKPACRGGKTTISILEEKYGSREYRLGKLKKEIALEHFELKGQNKRNPGIKYRPFKEMGDSGIAA